MNRIPNFQLFHSYLTKITLKNEIVYVIQQNNDTRVIQKAYETETSQALLSTVLYPSVKKKTRDRGVSKQVLEPGAIENIVL